MLLNCTLPPSMWAEAISTANYLHAWSPTSSNNDMTPYEKLFGRKPEVSHLQHFGCKAFKSLPASHRSKFGTRAHPLFILGFVYHSTTIWRFWDPHRRQVIQTSNVTFLESSGLDCSGRIRLDTSVVRLGLGASSELNSSCRLGLDASVVGLGLGTSSELNSSGRLGLDASAVGLGLGTSSELNFSGGLRLDASAVGLRLGTSRELNSSADSDATPQRSDSDSVPRANSIPWAGAADSDSTAQRPDSDSAPRANSIPRVDTDATPPRLDSDLVPRVEVSAIWKETPAGRIFGRDLEQTPTGSGWKRNQWILQIRCPTGKPLRTRGFARNGLMWLMRNSDLWLKTQPGTTSGWKTSSRRHAHLLQVGLQDQGVARRRHSV